MNNMTNNPGHQETNHVTGSAALPVTGSFPATYRHDLDRALQFIREHDDFLVVAHVHPDGDAISSTLAIGWLLRHWGKTYTMMNENRIPGRLHFLYDVKSVIISELEHKPEDRVFNAVICVDCADYERIGKIMNRVAPDAHILNIDHHPTNNHYGEVALIREDAAATAEILFDLYEHASIQLDVDVATILYTGLLTDTGGFRYSNTTPHVMAIASKLLAYGVNGNLIADRLLEQMTLAQMKLIQRGLSRLTFSEDNRISWLWITPEDMQETGALNEDLEGLVNYPRNVEGVEVGILFKQLEETRLKVSLRSGEKVNVAAIAQHFGGGGHIRAAGCTLLKPLDEAINEVIEQVKQHL
ncbi:DHH family phosphoesterase [Paenibacillus marinisediminis]